MSSLTISADLKLVVPARFDADGKPVSYLYHTPISREVYATVFRLLRDTKVNMLGTSGRHAFAARGDASLYLREAGTAIAADRVEDGDGGATALLGELTRLTMALVPTATGFEIMPVQSAIAAGALSADEWADAEASIVFFTAWVAGATRQTIGGEMKMAASFLNGSITSLPPMEWIASLRTSTPGAISEAKAASSGPS